MERRINKKIENYISDFKENVKKKSVRIGWKRIGKRLRVSSIYL